MALRSSHRVPKSSVSNVIVVDSSLSGFVASDNTLERFPVGRSEEAMQKVSFSRRESFAASWGDAST